VSVLTLRFFTGSRQGLSGGTGDIYVLHLRIENKPRVVNLRMLSKRSLKRNDKKSGKKKPGRNDYDNAEVLPAPDSEEIKKIEPPYKPGILRLTTLGLFSMSSPMYILAAKMW
jgi:hypothetical protein